jgi:hypothetical protein
MKEDMEGKVLQTVNLPASGIKWLRSGKEIELNNRMFDIKEISFNTDGTATIRGLFDDEETALTDMLKKQQDQNNNEGSRQLAQFFQILLAAPETHTSVNLLPLFIKGNLYPYFEADPVSAYRTILTPPPQIG